MATPKSKGGSCCAVASCKNYSGKAKNTGRTDLSFHRFPKDDLLFKVWSNKCRRINEAWNPSKSFICSDHFKQDDFVRNLKSELLGYAPKVKILKPDATPTLNLPDGHDKRISESGIRRQKRMETKLIRQAHNEIITLALNDNEPSSSTQHSECDLESTQSLGLSQPRDYEHLYNELLLEHKKLLTIKKSEVDYKKINENLRFQVRDLEKNLKVTNLVLKKNTRQIKLLSKNKTRDIDIQARKYLSSIFSKNQLDLIMKKKQRVHWSRDEISKALFLRYFSKRAYVYVKNVLKYPLPGLSSLQRWAKSINMRMFGNLGGDYNEPSDEEMPDLDNIESDTAGKGKEKSEDLPSLEEVKPANTA